MKLFRRSRPSPELRRTYRTQPDAQLGCEFVWEGSVHRPLVQDMSRDGMGWELLLPTSKVPRLDRKLLNLRLRLPHREEALFLEALVIRDVGEPDGRGGRRLGLRFRDTDRLPKSLAPHEYRHFNRRRSRRVPLPTQGRLPLILDPEGLHLRVLVHDLTTDGAGFFVDEEGHAALEQRVDWPALLRLGTGSNTHALQLNLRHRTALAKGHWVGTQFIERRRRSFAALRARLGDFVRAREAALQASGAWE